MTEVPSSDLPPDDVVAAEYALGLLSGQERADAARRRLREPGFAQAVEAWEARFAGMAEMTAAVAPPATLWARISARLASEGGADRLLVRRLKQSVTRWRSAAAVAAAIAACMVVALVLPRHAAPAPVLTARLSGSSHGPAVFVAFYDPTRRAIVLTPAEVKVTAQSSPELWLIPPGGKPVALGVADFAGSVQLISTQGVRGLAAGALAVSVEPRGGSPTGQPTGPVIATGQLSRL